MADNGFQLSRIQAEGWNAAHRIPAAQLADVDDGKVEMLNPYRKGSERRRWNTGFRSALKSWQR
ncbi:MAG: hypothetical protein ACREHV_04875 [Rhizomicrobium sp.]